MPPAMAQPHDATILGIQFHLMAALELARDLDIELSQSTRESLIDLLAELEFLAAILKALE